MQHSRSRGFARETSDGIDDPPIVSAALSPLCCCHEASETDAHGLPAKPRSLRSSPIRTAKAGKSRRTASFFSETNTLRPPPPRLTALQALPAHAVRTHSFYFNSLSAEFKRGLTGVEAVPLGKRLTVCSRVVNAQVWAPYSRSLTAIAKLWRQPPPCGGLEAPFLVPGFNDSRVLGAKNCPSPEARANACDWGLHGRGNARREGGCC